MAEVHGNVDRTRRRWTGALLGTVVLMNIAMVPSSTVAPLIAADSADPVWSGVPNAAGVMGTAVGALTLATLMRNRGRRIGMLLGYSVAATGALVGTFAVVSDRVPLLVIGMLLLGIGNGGAQLARYAAADLYPAERKGFVLSIVVWGGTVGALVGPSLIAPAARAAGAAGLPPYAGSYALALLATAAAAVGCTVLPRVATAEVPARRRPYREGLAALQLPAVRLALTAMVAAQLSMVAVMTMTPLQLTTHGHGLDVIGWVLSAHLVGMFALSPLSGRLADRFGGRTAITCGTGVLIAAAAVAVAAPTSHDAGLPLALFLLGYGWNLCFVGGSSLLSRDLPEEPRIQLQGLVDGIVWGSAAFASLSAGAIFAGGGYSVLALLAGALAAAPLVVLILQPRPGPTNLPAS